VKSRSPGGRKTWRSLMAEVPSPVSGRRRSAGFCSILTAWSTSGESPARVAGGHRTRKGRKHSAEIRHQHNACSTPPHRRGFGAIGLAVAMDDVFTPAILACAFLVRENLAPFLVVHPDLREDFDGLPAQGRRRSSWATPAPISPMTNSTRPFANPGRRRISGAGEKSQISRS